MTGAQCGNPARWDLRGGPPARAVPTATNCEGLAGVNIQVPPAGGFSQLTGLALAEVTFAAQAG